MSDSERDSKVVKFFKSRKGRRPTDLTWEEKTFGEYLYPKDATKLQKFMDRETGTKGERRRKGMKKGFTHESAHNESKEWYTPQFIFDALGIEFDLDPCSPGKEIVPWIPARHHLTIEEDGLTAVWEGNVFMNPPYGTDTPKWFKKLAEHGNGIGLVFARTDTQWFQNFVPLADGICFIRGRVSFISAKYAGVYARGHIFVPRGGCGAASMLIAFGEQNNEALRKANLGLYLKIPKKSDIL